MELDAIKTDIAMTKSSNNANLYENITHSKNTSQASEHQIDKNELGHYESLTFSDTSKVKKENKDNALKKMKCAICVITVLILVLYIGLISLIIVLFSSKDSVDGQWTHWSNWTSCDVTCGNGTHLRSRGCASASPRSKGRDCIGESLQSSQCFNDDCSVQSQWTVWSSWSECDVTCGTGRRLRIRICTIPAPSSGRENCIGEGVQTSACSRSNCPAKTSAFTVKTPYSYSNINGIPKLNFSDTVLNVGNDFNISTGTYKCSIPGVYYFSVTLVKKRASSRVDQVYCRLYKNSQRLINIQVDPTDDDTDKGSAAISQSIVIDLDSGDTVYLTGCNGSPSKYMEDWSSFTGFFLHHNN